MENWPNGYGFIDDIQPNIGHWPFCSFQLDRSIKIVDNIWDALNLSESLFYGCEFCNDRKWFMAIVWKNDEEFIGSVGGRGGSGR